MPGEGPGQLVLFGGSTADRTALTDTWTWDGTNWTQATPATSPPASAANGTMAYDPATHQTLLVGGHHDDFTVPTDTWSWNGSNWTDLSPVTNPSTRRAMSIDYDQATGQLVLFGWGGDTCPGPSPGLAQGCTPNVTTNPTSVQPPIQQVTTVHTGEPWAGSRPLVLVVGAAGAILIGLGSLRRRQVRREPVRVDH